MDRVSQAIDAPVSVTKRSAQRSAGVDWLVLDFHAAYDTRAWQAVINRFCGNPIWSGLFRMAFGDVKSPLIRLSWKVNSPRHLSFVQSKCRKAFDDS